MDNFRIDFIGVGAARAGTTWLYECLRQHPQVCMSDPKELNYFCTRHMWRKVASNHGESERWLRARFLHHQAGQIRGEMSPSYLVDAQSPRLIYERFPDARIIVSYRNPSDSLYSLYLQAAKYYSVPPTLEEFLAAYGFVANYGFYYTHTARYLDRFPIERIHFIIFDDICTDPEGVLVDLFGFLGIATEWRAPSAYKRVNVRQAPRVILLRDLIGAAQELINSSPRALRLRRLVRLLGFDRAAAWVWERNLRAAAFPPMTEETRDRLRVLYAEENLLLGELVGRDLSHWNE